MIRSIALPALLWAGLAGAEPGAIFGTIELLDGRSFTGAISWDEEEIYWAQHFNGRHEEPFDLSGFDASTRKAILDRQPGPQLDLGEITVEFVKWFSDPEMRPTDFSVEFGAIDRLEQDRGLVTVHLRDGSVFRTSGGSNDIGADLEILDEEGAGRDIDFDDVAAVRFAPMPPGHPIFRPQLYGVVETRFGAFAGVIAWDSDERYGDEELDGDLDGEDRSFDFDLVREIESLGNASRVTLADGRELVLDDSNDVDDENRGIIVVNPEFGRILVGWEDFERIRFEPVPEGFLPGREAWATAGPLRGRVGSSDGEWSGTLVYDVDERTAFDTLDGRRGESRFWVPFHRIARLERSGEGVAVTLLSGRALALERDQDVSDANSGLVLVEGESRRYLPWPEVRWIAFGAPTP